MLDNAVFIPFSASAMVHLWFFLLFGGWGGGGGTYQRNRSLYY